MENNYPSTNGVAANIALKRDAPYRGGFGGLLFFRLRWLRQSSVTGAPLSFTLGIQFFTSENHL